MDEYESTGHMAKFETDSIISPKYYIPHHFVLKPQSSGWSSMLQATL